MANYRAAFVPDDDPQRPWEDAQALAVAWIADEARGQGKEAVLVTDAFGSYTDDWPLNRFSRPTSHTTPRSGRHGLRSVPVLAYVPNRGTLEFAINLAHGSSLCVVEDVSDPLAGWAAAVGALNLVANEQMKLDPRLTECLDRLAFYGNNAYTKGWGRDNAQKILEDIAADGLLDRGLILSALAAHAISSNGQDNLGKLIDATQSRQR
jgi:hypothetical protein